MFLLFLHPVYWIWLKAIENQSLGSDTSGWILLAIFAIPLWVLGARFLAEIPGRSTGQMYLWWGIFLVFHIWGLAVYILMEKLATRLITRWRFERKIELADRNENDILSSPFGPIGSQMTGPIELTGLPGVAPYDMSPLSRDPYDQEDPDKS